MGVASIAARLSNRNNSWSSHRIEHKNAGYDIGMDRAIRDRLKKHRALWAAAQDPSRRPKPVAPPAA